MTYQKHAFYEQARQQSDFSHGRNAKAQASGLPLSHSTNLGSVPRPASVVGTVLRILLRLCQRMREPVARSSLACYSRTSACDEVRILLGTASSWEELAVALLPTHFHPSTHTISADGWFVYTVAGDSTEGLTSRR